MDLLHLCVTPTYCQYNSKHRKQIHGRAIGSPISIVVAEIVMQNIEEQALATYGETLPLCGYVVVQFLLWNNLFLNWDKIVWTGTK